MPTLSAPRRKRRPKTPIERAAAPAAAPDSPAPAPVPETLPPDLTFRREMAIAMCMSLRMERWLYDRVAAWGIPLDNCLLSITLLTIYVEAMLKALVRFPEYLPTVIVEDDEPAGREWIVEDGDAYRAGLHPVRKRPGKRKPVPSLPGCPGVDEPCLNLRRGGERYCPDCAHTVRTRLRGG